jgi:RNA polymerase sigma-70 factor, ECF subfamily
VPAATDFEALYERYARDVLRFALYLSGNRALAEDITSETFVRVWTSPTAVRPTTVKAYLFTIARRLFLDGRRRDARLEPLEDRHVDAGPGPHDSAAARHQLEATLRALQALPEVDRAALLMRAQDGLAYEAIAASLGVSVAAAKVKVHRARVRLAQAGLGPGKEP